MTDKEIKLEEKFIVLNKKRLDELNEYASTFSSHPAVKKLCRALDDFKEAYEADTEKSMGQQYYVCNQDEPYADEVIRIILAGEEEKER